MAPPSPGVASGPVAARVHCRFCNAFLCAGSSLKSQGTTIVCADAEFERLVKPPKIVGGKRNIRILLSLVVIRSFGSEIPVSESIVSPRARRCYSFVTQCVRIRLGHQDSEVLQRE